MSSSLSPVDLSYPQQFALQKYSSSPTEFLPSAEIHVHPQQDLFSSRISPAEGVLHQQVGYSSPELSPRLALISSSPVCREFASPVKLPGYSPSSRSGCSYPQTGFIPQTELASRFDRLQQISYPSLSARSL